MRSVGLAACLCLVTAPLAAQTAHYVVRLGRDTVALERVTRSGSKVTGDLFTTSPRARRVHYVVTLDKKGNVSRFDMTSAPAVETPPSPMLTVTEAYGDTIATVVVARGTAKPDTVRMKIHPGAIPFVGLSTGLLEQMTLQGARSKRDSMPFDMVVAGQPAAQANWVVKRGADSVAVDFFGLPFYLKVDKKGQVWGVNGMRTTQKFLIDRVASLDLAAVSAPFVDREKAGHVAGVMSPRDTAKASLAAPVVWVDYGRPYKRGREILGNVVPYGQVWRTGANAATQLNTTVDLRVGDQVIPAGKYTLWTLPTPNGTKLIINQQTGQWGTEYDASKDLLRLDLKTEGLPESVERFTISVVPMGSAGEIRFDWDKTRWVLPFQLK